MNQKKIKIKFHIANSLDQYCYHIYIYDSDENILLDDFTNQMGEVFFSFPYYGLYKIVVKSGDKTVFVDKETPIFIHKSSPNELIFLFWKSALNKYSPITFSLTDKHYKGLKIKKGEIILWNST